MVYSLLIIRISPVEAVCDKASLFTQLREGWTYVSGSIPIRGILTLFAVISLMGWPFVVLMPVFAAQVLHGGPHTLGFLTGAVGVGAMVAALGLVMRRSVRGLVDKLPHSAFLFGGALVLFGFSHWLWLSLLLMVVAGYGMVRGLVSSNTILQTVVDEEMRGRTMSYYTLALLGLAPIGSLLTGIAGNAIGAPKTVMISGVACIAGGMWFWSQLGRTRAEILPIYQRMGIVNPPDSAAAEEREN